MRFLFTFTAQMLRCVLVVSCFAILASSQNNATSGPVNHLYKVQSSTGQIIADTFIGTRLQGAAAIAAKGSSGWGLVGVADLAHDGTKGIVYWERSTGALAVIFYGDTMTVRGSSALATPGSGWTPAVVADLNGDGHPDVVFVNNATGQVDVFFQGGSQGTTFLSRRTISLLSATGWNVVGAADLNNQGHADLILQNPSTGQVVVNYLGAKGTTVTATRDLGAFPAWSVSGMQDMNADGHPDLVLSNRATGQSMVSYFGGVSGTTPLGSAYLDRSGSPGWDVVVPTASASTSASSSSDSLATAPTAVADAALDAPIMAAGTTPVLIFNGTGTSSSDVTAVENVVKAAGLAYKTANSSQLDGMTQSQLAAYKLFIVPGGDSVKIGNNLTSKATTNVHNAVAQNGLNYLGFCAGGFFGGFSKYNGLNLTSGTWFSFYADYYKGIHKEAVSISFPAQGKLDIYWQNGPDLSGWGKVVGKYPNGKPAIVEGYLGQGFVILVGVHPEAPAAWRYGMNFNTPLDVDLAYARTLTKAALNRTMLPHY